MGLPSFSAGKYGADGIHVGLAGIIQASFWLRKIYLDHFHAYMGGFGVFGEFGLKTDADIRQEGMRALNQTLGEVEAEGRMW